MLSSLNAVRELSESGGQLISGDPAQWFRMVHLARKVKG